MWAGKQKRQPGNTNTLTSNEMSGAPADAKIEPLNQTGVLDAAGNGRAHINTGCSFDLCHRV
jgi:hypothetical protein